MAKSNRKILKRFVIIMLTLLVLIGLLAVMAFAGLRETTYLEIGSVDMQMIPDGCYIGSYTNFRWSTTVKVTVEDHYITEITPVTIQSGRAPLVQDLKDAVLIQQTLDIDTVSSATASSNAFLKAVENALIEGSTMAS